MSQACHNLLLSSVTTYYQKRSEYQKQLSMVIKGLSPISLRLIDWFVTHYAQSNNVLYWINDQTNEMTEEYPNNGGSHIRKFNLYLDYRAQLKSYTKLYFDCFRRHERITFVIEEDPLKTLETTVGQLNFFRWAFQNHVLEYIMNHLSEIEQSMAKYQKNLKKNQTIENGNAKNKEGGKSSINMVIHAPCHVRFD